VNYNTCYSATFVSQTRDQKCFTILLVIANMHPELMILQLTMHPSLARVSDQLDPRYTQQTYHHPSQSHQTHLIAHKLLPILHPPEGRRQVDLNTKWVRNSLNLACFVNDQWWNL